MIAEVPLNANVPFSYNFIISALLATELFHLPFWGSHVFVCLLSEFRQKTPYKARIVLMLPHLSTSEVKIHKEYRWRSSPHKTFCTRHSELAL
jgi:hypothetical protein